MQNEFEKQVKLKMEELDLVPSAPVWKKIEEQIRETKDRRRLILWIFLGVLLVGGSMFWLSNSNFNREEVAKTNNRNLPVSQPGKELNSSTNNESSPNDQQNNSKQNNTRLSEINKPEKAESMHEEATGVAAVNSLPTKKSIAVTREKKSGKNNSDKSFAAILVEKGQSKNGQNNSSVDGKNEKTVDPSQQKAEVPTKKITDSAAIKKVAAATVVVASAEDKIRKNEDKSSVSDIAIKDTAVSAANLTAVAAPKHHQSKWQIGFSTGAGASALTNGLNFGTLFDRQQAFSFDQAIPSTTVAIPYVRGYVTPVRGTERKSTSFSFGMVVRKLIGKKLNFSSGLNYSYYSTIIDRGNITTSMAGSGSGSGIGSNGGTGSGSNGAFYNYVNQFHFIGLPVAVDIRPVRKLPVHVRGGVSVQQLVSSNALIFDQMSKAYTHNENAYQKTQIFSELGLNYSLRRKNAQMLIGPQFSYGITKLEKIYPSRHLFSFGLNAQFLFSKK